MRIARNIFILALAIAFVCPVMGQTIGDFKMDETELYAMTKQMGQFIRRFNYEEDQFGFKLNPKDPKYRSNEMRRQSLPILFDQERYGSQTELQRYFIEDVTKSDSSYMTFLGGRWYSEVSTTFRYEGKDVQVMLFLAVEKEGLGSKWVLTLRPFSPRGPYSSEEPTMTIRMPGFTARTASSRFTAVAFATGVPKRTSAAVLVPSHS